MKTNFNYRKFLIHHLELKQQKNPAYTIGAFGRLLGIEASRMSEILKGKVGISVKRAIDIAKILKFSENDKNMFILLVQTEHERNPAKKAEAIKKLAQFREDSENTNNITEQMEDSINQWQHYALLELIGLNVEDLDNKLMAKKLGISLEIVDTALSELQSLKLIEAINGSKITYKVLHQNRKVHTGFSSESLVRLNAQVLEKAIFELTNKVALDREFSFVMLRFNKKQIEQLKERTKQFRAEIIKEFDGVPGHDAVYCVSLQYFELTGKDKDLDKSIQVL
jgi:uncharacterized protein (TIGR02147 family)